MSELTHNIQIVHRVGADDGDDRGNDRWCIVEYVDDWGDQGVLTLHVGAHGRPVIDLSCVKGQPPYMDFLDAAEVKASIDALLDFYAKDANGASLHEAAPGEPCTLEGDAA